MNKKKRNRRTNRKEHGCCAGYKFLEVKGRFGSVISVRSAWVTKSIDQRVNTYGEACAAAVVDVATIGSAGVFWLVVAAEPFWTPGTSANTWTRDMCARTYCQPTYTYLRQGVFRPAQATCNEKINDFGLG